MAAQDREWALDLIDETRQPVETKSVTLGVPANDYATSFICAWSNPERGVWTSDDIELLRHVNCSYLSSGKLPTLLALKQHAQSLTNLIRKLSVSSTSGAVDGKGNPISFRKNEAFDWLNNLDVPYTNTDDSHNTPLASIANQVKDELEGPNGNTIEFRCPLEPILGFGPLVDKDKKEQKCRPYQTHANLLHHANECLEILDHEYSATGGLMSILPTDQGYDKEQLEGARNTLVGQWLLHHQHLVGRMHELEISYANALDVLAGEAVVPLQMLSSRGLDGRSIGRQVAYPQDRFLLVNSGDDVFNHIHQQLDKIEDSFQTDDQVWRNSGVSGERMRAHSREGKEYTRGLISVDISSRFYRLKGQIGGKGTIFVLPAADDHPGVRQTRLIEDRPTIVSIVTPTWPERVSDLQRKHEERLEEGDKAIQMKRVLLKDRDERKKTIVRLLDEADQRKKAMDKLTEERDTEKLKAEDCLRLWNGLKDGLANVRDSFPEAVKDVLDSFLGDTDDSDMPEAS